MQAGTNISSIVTAPNTAVGSSTHIKNRSLTFSAPRSQATTTLPKVTSPPPPKASLWKRLQNFSRMEKMLRGAKILNAGSVIPTRNSFVGRVKAFWKYCPESLYPPSTRPEADSVPRESRAPGRGRQSSWATQCPGCRTSKRHSVPHDRTVCQQTYTPELSGGAQHILDLENSGTVLNTNPVVGVSTQRFHALEHRAQHMIADSGAVTLSAALITPSFTMQAGGCCTEPNQRDGNVGEETADMILLRTHSRDSLVEISLKESPLHNDGHLRKLSVSPHKPPSLREEDAWRMRTDDTSEIISSQDLEESINMLKPSPSPSLTSSSQFGYLYINNSSEVVELPLTLPGYHVPDEEISIFELPPPEFPLITLKSTSNLSSALQDAMSSLLIQPLSASSSSGEPPLSLLIERPPFPANELSSSQFLPSPPHSSSEVMGTSSQEQSFFIEKDLEANSSPELSGSKFEFSPLAECFTIDRGCVELNSLHPGLLCHPQIWQQSRRRMSSITLESPPVERCSSTRSSIQEFDFSEDEGKQSIHAVGAAPICAVPINNSGNPTESGPSLIAETAKEIYCTPYRNHRPVPAPNLQVINPQVIPTLLHTSPSLCLRGGGESEDKAEARSKLLNEKIGPLSCWIIGCWVKGGTWRSFCIQTGKGIKRAKEIEDAERVAKEANEREKREAGDVKNLQKQEKVMNLVRWVEQYFEKRDDEQSKYLEDTKWRW